MANSWLTSITLTSSIASLITAISALTAFVFLRRQQIQTERQIIGATSRYMYEEMGRLLGILLDHPELRPFIYEGHALDQAATKEQRQQILALAGLYSDFFEQLLYQRTFGNLSVDEYSETWEHFTRTILTSSEVLRNYALDNPDYYGSAYLQFVRHMQASISEKSSEILLGSNNAGTNLPQSQSIPPDSETVVGT
jgi:hypothetical protein